MSTCDHETFVYNIYKMKWGDQMKKGNFKAEIINAVVDLGIFYFVFLGSEYLFDNMMAYVTDSAGVVLAQSYILGISAVGFCCYALLGRVMKKQNPYIVMFVTMLPAIICIFVIQQHLSYLSVMISGLILFLILGILGSAVHYNAFCSFSGSRHLAGLVGISYALGILLQFINNNLISQEMIEAVVLAVFLSVMTILLVKNKMFAEKEADAVWEDKGLSVSEADGERRPEKPLVAGILFAVIVALMSCIFATLDNAVTLAHAGGTMDIGQWPRILLGLSGLLAGVCFDIKNRKYMNIIMYCVMLLSTLCVVMVVFGGPFLAGLIVFYLSAGFFSVFFTAGFMELSAYMQVPKLWAGMGRAVNNVCAIITSVLSVTLLSAKNGLVITATVLVIFAAVSVVICIYTNLFSNTAQKKSEPEDETMGKDVPDSEALFHAFAEEYTLTEREKEVFRLMLDSDENVQEMATRLGLSRAALYRHMGNINEKTNTTSRIGLIQFYFAWENEKIRKIL